MCNRLLNCLAVLCAEIIRNNNIVICCILNIVRNELPLLIAVAALPFTVELFACGKAYDLYLSDLVFTDRTGELKLNRGIL